MIVGSFFWVIMGVGISCFVLFLSGCVGVHFDWVSS